MLCIPVLWKDYTSRELYLIEFISSLLSVLCGSKTKLQSNIPANERKFQIFSSLPTGQICGFKCFCIISVSVESRPFLYCLRLSADISQVQTLFSTSFVLIVFQESKDFSMITTGLLWIFQASTEQMIFVGLLMCRLFSLPHPVTSLDMIVLK